MKKTLLTFTILLRSAALTRAGGPAKVQSLIKQYRDKDGFETLSIGPMGMLAARVATRLSSDIDQEDLAILRSFDSIRRLTFLDFSDADSTDREHFTQKMKKALKGMELILEAKDDGDGLSIYGIDDGKKVRDCILYSPDDGTVICVRGSIDLEKLMAAAGHD